MHEVIAYLHTDRQAQTEAQTYMCICMNVCAQVSLQAIVCVCVRAWLRDCSWVCACNFPKRIYVCRGAAVPTGQAP